MSPGRCLTSAPSTPQLVTSFHRSSPVLHSVTLPLRRQFLLLLTYVLHCIQFKALANYVPMNVCGFVHKSFSVHENTLLDHKVHACFALVNITNRVPEQAMPVFISTSNVCYLSTSKCLSSCYYVACSL